MITQQQLESYLGKSIGDICQNGYTTAADKHATHFVSHVLGYQFGVTCQMMGSGRGRGATIRIEDLFAKCKSVGVWALRPRSLSTCLVFVTRTSNINLAAQSMSKGPRRHVGIYINGLVWHYSTRRQQVVKEPPSQFKLHYRAPDNAVFYGSLP